jgi:hypothetical protein
MRGHRCLQSACDLLQIILADDGGVVSVERLSGRLCEAAGGLKWPGGRSTEASGRFRAHA